MNLAILHYHLNRGGVTRVIENQLAALDAVLDPAEPWQVAVIYGGRCNGLNQDIADLLRAIRLSFIEVPMLDYDGVQSDGGRHAPAELLMELYAALGRLDFQPQQTVLHVHNHSLGKNRCLPEVVPILAQDGYAVLLQIHDFAEDFRPTNYRLLGDPAEVYPQAAGIHYAVINGRDHNILRTAGIEPERLHLLPNPVPEMGDTCGDMCADISGTAVSAVCGSARANARAKLQQQFGVGQDDCFVLYPVRCIRRKNIGEALLYGALAPAGTVVGLTLAPANPVEVPIYTAWKELAAELNLPCRFEVGAPGALSFAENLAAADVILTTSLAEGFGMVFVESWLAGRPLVGRDLPEITPDFAGAGVQLDRLWPRLCVPVNWIGADDFRHAVVAAYRRTLETYGREEKVSGTFCAKHPSGRSGKRFLTPFPEPPFPEPFPELVDFGELNEPMQRQVIELVCRDETNRRRVFDANPWLGEVFAVRVDTASDVIQQNADAIRREFSLEPSGRRLVDLYEQVISSPRDESPEPLPNAGRILDQFLSIDRFRLIRT